MTDKIFKKTLSERLKKGLVIGAALFSLGGVQETKAQGILERITNTIENVNNKVNSVNIKISNYNYQKARLKKNIERFDRNTGGLVKGAAQAIAVQRAQQVVREQIKQNGTYQASPQEFSQAAQISRSTNSEYLSNVKGKLHKKSAEYVRTDQEQTTQQTQKQTTQSTKRRASSRDVKKVYDILNANMR